MSQDNLIPSAPKIAGVNRTFLYGAAACVGLVILLAVFSGGGSHSLLKHEQEQSIADASQEVQSIKAKKVKILLAKHPSPIHQVIGADSNPKLIEHMSPEAFQQAAASKIGVFNEQSNAAPSVVPGVSLKLPPILPNANAQTLPNEDPYTNQNAQAHKQAFLTQETNSKDANQLDSTLSTATSDYELMAGSIISANLLTGINSDLPGKIIAKVSRDIYDTRSGNYLLIPQGTTVTGVYDSNLAYGQNRVLIAWSRLIFPNGSSIDLQGMPGVDLAGMAGLHDLVDNHYLRIFGSALLMSLFGASGQLSQPQSSGNTLTNQQILFAAVGNEMSQTAAQMVSKNMNIQPTIEIRPGANFNILVTKDMVFPGPYQFDHQES